MVKVHVAKKNMVLFVIHRKKNKNFTDWRKIIYCRIIITSLIVKWDWYIRLQCRWHLNVDQHIKKEDSIYITYTGVYQVIKSINLYCYQCCVTFGNQSWLLLFSVTFDLLWLYLKGIYLSIIQNCYSKCIGFFFPDFFSTNSQVHSSKFSFNMYCCLIFCCFFLLLQTLISYVVYNYYNMSVFSDSNEFFFLQIVISSYFQKIQISIISIFYRIVWDF